ncbi:MAG TPA: Ni/Fe hydrogenase subunit alpha [Vicinamibacterales bacterium]|nr:Ni/Fe hydrogenase subunit alpha [Vicinamibacterales bacterium]
MSRTIVVDHLARIEGHAGISVELEGREIRDVRFDVFEGIRLFEGLVRGRMVDEVPGIVSRICAICSHGHVITAMRALERALGITVSPQTRRLRELAFHGSAIESHALHVFCLALPDFLQLPSVIELAGKDPEIVATALRLKKLGNSIQETIGGRAVHPVTHVIGGFSRVPSVDDLVRLRGELAAGLDDCARVAEVLRTIPIPAFADEPIHFAAIDPDPDSYFFGDRVRTDEGTTADVQDYRSFTQERAVPHSTARHSMTDRPRMVGALARLALYGDRIDGRARELWQALGPREPWRNVVMNDIAQVVELVFSIEHGMAIVDGLLATGVEPEPVAPVAVRPGRAAAATEVPRGTLFHAYEIDGSGRIASADVITPTAQNCAHLEEQVRATVRHAGDASDDDLRLRLSIVARAYDPCVSCSVHMTRLG